MASSTPSSRADPAITIDYKSLERVCPNRNISQLMFYAWEHCHYYSIKFKMRDEVKAGACEVKKVFDWQLASFEQIQKLGDAIATTLDGRFIEKVEVSHVAPEELAKGPESKLTRQQWCKFALTNMVLENYKRAREGKDVIPVIFATDVDNNPWPSTAESIATKHEFHNDRITHKEMRRIYKLCYELRDGLEDVQEVAKRTFVFVKVSADNKKCHSFTKIEPFWNLPNWKEEWAKRKQAVKKVPSYPAPVHWKVKLRESIERHHLLSMRLVSRL